MLLHKLVLRQFRAHTESELRFSPGINLIYGPNGAGKTNVLEAVYYLCIGRSFVASKDSYALQFDRAFFDLKGEFESELNRRFDVRLVYKTDEGKRAFVNGVPLDRLSDLVGRVPVVVFAPSDHALTDGPPEERRRFLDNTLSQAKPAYLAELLNYRRTMKQRNALLGRGTLADPALLEPWNEEFSRSASKITAFRASFITEFNSHLSEAFKLMKEISERPSIRYRAFTPLPGDADFVSIHDLHRSKLREALSRERDLKRSLIGPHRDELIFTLNDIEVRRFASQGQHRTFGMALKLAKFLYLKSRLDETPLLLLDDVFGDLDQHRSEVFLRLLEESSELGQCFITSADDQPFRKTLDFEIDRHSAHMIANGDILSAYA